jgi:lysophospholipase L1-like esterase
MAATRKTRPTTKAKRRTKAAVQPGEQAAVRGAIAQGRAMAERAIAARARKTRALAAAGGGVLIAEGDSWFDYPFFDVLERLEDGFGFEVESVAHKGDTVESMAYDPSQTSKLARLFERLGGQGRQPRAILLSGGGNDVAGDEFALLLNHAASGLPVLNDQIVSGVVDQRIKMALACLIAAVTTLSRRYFGRAVPVLVHGYGHAIPDGRGYLGGAWFLPGPWLKPGFTAKGYGVLSDNAQVVATLIDRFNAMLATLPQAPGLSHVTYVDLRGALNSNLQGYRQSWGNELHPTRAGFESVAGVVARVIQALP